MYAQFFGLSHEPFSIAPDPRYLFMSERHREALAHLLYGVGGGGGFVLLSGEIGTGKTTVCRCFLEQIPKACNVAYIFNPKLTVDELLRSVCDEFHIAYAAATIGGTPTTKDYVDALNGFLLRTHAEGQNNVLIIDEAQNLSADVLEQLRLLTNLETNERKLLQIMLIGQPELRTMLARPELEQLAQRVVARFHLDALTEAETTQYIQHRLAVAGLKGAAPFDRKALKRIHQLTRGVPRRINLLCDRAMLGAFATGKAVVDKAIVEKAAGEVFESTAFAPSAGAGLFGMSPRAGGVLAGAVAMAVLAALGLALYEKTIGQGTNVAARPAMAAGSAPAKAAALPASAASAPASAATAVDLQATFNTLPRDDNAALRLLAQAWKLQLPEGDACAAAARSDVQCFRRVGSLAVLRQLNRPVVLVLYDDAGQRAFAPLTLLGEQTATLQAGNGVAFTVPLHALAGMWRGEYRTLWRAPAGYSPRLINAGRGPLVDWLGERLAAQDKQAAPAAGQPMDTALRERLQAFQRMQGVAADGVPGPVTQMLLNRATGVDEPRLMTDR